MNGINVATSSWPQVGRRLADGWPAVIPIGAASKEHGRHLPLDTDFRQAEWIAARVRKTREVVVWPTVAYGYYPVFVDYPGSISLREETFVALIGDILAGVAHAGASRVIILNTGISTTAPLESLIARRANSPPCKLVNVYAGAQFARVSEALAEQRWGGHADELETSIMLALAPAHVNLPVARPAPTPIVRGLFNRSDPDAPNYSPDGVNGDPTLATPAKGEALLGAMLADVLEAIGSA
ncbi:MAG: creatininase family protein [Gammaproteobacteria bacterium]|jgi:creatinine amidohydrolase